MLQMSSCQVCWIRSDTVDLTMQGEKNRSGGRVADLVRTPPVPSWLWVTKQCKQETWQTGSGMPQVGRSQDGSLRTLVLAAPIGERERRLSVLAAGGRHPRCAEQPELAKEFQESRPHLLPLRRMAAAHMPSAACNWEGRLHINQASSHPTAHIHKASLPTILNPAPDLTQSYRHSLSLNFDEKRTLLHNCNSSDCRILRMCLTGINTKGSQQNFIRRWSWHMNAVKHSSY